MLDDITVNDISLYNGGAEDSRSIAPGIANLAHQGTKFENVYSANGVGTTSQPSLFAGRYSARFGFEYAPIFTLGLKMFQWVGGIESDHISVLVDQENTDEVNELDLLGMPNAAITIAEVLQEIGYYRAHIKKCHVNKLKEMVPHRQDFDNSLAIEESCSLQEDHPNVVNYKLEDDEIDRMIDGSRQSATLINGSKRIKFTGHCNDYHTNEIWKVIGNHRYPPFFLDMSHWGWAKHNPILAMREEYKSVSY